MPAHAMASATISFGLVSIPVKLFSATSSASSISFNMLHKKCGTRVKQQYVCPSDNEVVSRDATVKGYEFAKDKYVQFTAEELKALEETSTQSIDISEFIPLSKIDPIYFEKGYYLGPDKGGDKAYRLLSEVLQRTGRAALARYSARSRGYLVLLRPHDGRLVMQQLYFADEVKGIEDVDTGAAELKENEIKLAMALVDQGATEEFHPEKYKDDVKERTQALIDKKVAGQEISVAPAESPRGQVIDLMEALKASLAGAAPRAAAAEPEAAAEERKPAKRAPRAESEPRKVAKK